MADEDPEVQKEAILAAGRSLNPDFIPLICDFLEQKTFREVATQALLRYGVNLIVLFDQIILQKQARPSVTRLLPGVVSKLGHQSGVLLLQKWLENEDVTLKLEALRALNDTRLRFPQLKISDKGIISKIIIETDLYRDTLATLYAQLDKDQKDKPSERVHQARLLLVDLLERRVDGTLERIFRLLGLRYPPDEIIPVFNGIRSKNPDIRLNAVEYLDNILESGLKKILIPIFETAFLSSGSEDAIKRLKIDVPTEYECFAMILQGGDLKMKNSVLNLIGELKERKYLELVAPFRDHHHPKLAALAQKVYAELSR